MRIDRKEWKELMVSGKTAVQRRKLLSDYHGKVFLQQVPDLNPRVRDAELPSGDETAKR